MNSDYDDTDFWDRDEIECSAGNSNIPLFKSMTTDEITFLMNQYIREVKSIVKLPATATNTRVLLCHTKWERDELLVRLTANDHDFHSNVVIIV